MTWAVVLALVVTAAPAAACTAGRGATIGGIDEAMHWKGDGAHIYGNHVTLKHNAGLSLMSDECSDSWQPGGFKKLQLLGRTLSFTVDLSRVGCACNVAVYLIETPAKDATGKFHSGTCPWSPYYCDANQVCGSFCPEVDIMEANNHAFQSTPHKCDAPSEAGHYASCDRAGCAQNTKDQGANVYGPGAGFRIDTTQPFQVITTFHGSSQLGEGAGMAPASFTGMTTVLRQAGREVILDHSMCSGYYGDLVRPMADGMSLRVTYWGDTPQNMSWMDMPPCGYEKCSGSNAGVAVMNNLEVSLPAKIRFPISFEEGSLGSCPSGWSCLGGAKICDYPRTTVQCWYPGLKGVRGSKYLSLGDDNATGIITSPVFILPDGIDSMRFRRSGGAGHGSGLYLRRRIDSSLLCSSEAPVNTNAMFEVSCPGLARHAGEAAYIQIKDSARGSWAKVLVDDIHLVSKSGESLDAVQVSLHHAGESCLKQCGKAGYCSWCGSGNACCSGSPDDPSECAGARVELAGRHQCVEPASQVVMQRAGEDCWAHCARAGFCEWCGSGNACCHRGVAGAPPECRGVLHSSDDHFECVIPTFRDVSFPLSFERSAEWSCPDGWHCTGDAGVCRVGSISGLCLHPGVNGTDGAKYLVVGNDKGVGTATSPVFVLPDRIDNIVFRRSGGANRGSGFFLHSKTDGRLLCSAENGTNTNAFFEEQCKGLSGHGGEPVFIHLRDTQKSDWGKVMIDDIHLRDAFGMELPAEHLWVTRSPNLFERAADDFIYFVEHRHEGEVTEPVRPVHTVLRPLWIFSGFSLASFAVCLYFRTRREVSARRTQVYTSMDRELAENIASI